MTTIIEYHINMEYISTQLCENTDKPAMHCNGKCYLVKQMKKDMQDEKTQGEPSGKIPDIKNTDHLATVIYSSGPQLSWLPVFYISQTHTRLLDFQTSVFNPPEIA